MPRKSLKTMDELKAEEAELRKAAATLKQALQVNQRKQDALLADQRRRQHDELGTLAQNAGLDLEQLKELLVRQQLKHADGAMRVGANYPPDTDHEGT